MVEGTAYVRLVDASELQRLDDIYANDQDLLRRQLDSSDVSLIDAKAGTGQ
jgi:hypothetical protein